MNTHNRKGFCRLAVACLALLLWAGAAHADDPCLGSSAWIQEPGLPDFTKEPANDCAFHQMAWQTFLYLVQPLQKGALRFETFQSVDDIFGQTATASSCTDQDDRIGKRRNFRLRARKARTPGTEQAGSNGILVDQEGNVTLYETYFDPTFVSFIAACNLTVKACETVDPTLQVPVGTLELKVSWRPIRRDDPNYERFYTLQGRHFRRCADRPVRDARRRDGSGSISSTRRRVIPSSSGRPSSTSPTRRTVPAPGPPRRRTGFVRWTYNDAKSTDCANANQLPDMTKQPYPVTQVVRNWAYGTNPAAVFGTDTIQQLKALNTSMAALLPGKSVWRNYFLVGSVWTDNGALPARPADLRGGVRQSRGLRPPRQCHDGDLRPEP